MKGKELNHEGQDSGPEKQDTSDKVIIDIVILKIKHGLSLILKFTF